MDSFLVYIRKTNEPEYAPAKNNEEILNAQQVISAMSAENLLAKIRALHPLPLSVLRFADNIRVPYGFSENQKHQTSIKLIDPPRLKISLKKFIENDFDWSAFKEVFKHTDTLVIGDQWIHLPLSIEDKVKKTLNSQGFALINHNLIKYDPGLAKKQLSTQKRADRKKEHIKLSNIENFCSEMVGIIDSAFKLYGFMTLKSRNTRYTMLKLCHLFDNIFGKNAHMRLKAFKRLIEAWEKSPPKKKNEFYECVGKLYENYKRVGKLKTTKNFKPRLENPYAPRLENQNNKKEGDKK